MKRLRLQLLLALILMSMGVAVMDAQTYKATYATKLYLSGGGSPVKPLTLEAPTLSSPYTLIFPANDGDANQFLQTDGAGNLVWASLNTALLPLSASLSDAGILLDITNTGTGDVAQFEISNASSTGNALTAITNGTGLAFLANGNVQVSNGNLTLANTGTAGELRLHEAGGADYTAFVAQDQSGNNITYTLPATNGTAGQALVVASSPTPTAASATLEWSSAGLSSVTHNATLSGSGTSGSPLAVNLGNANTWTANQTFAGTFVIASNSRIALTNSDNNGRDIRWQEPSGTGTQYVGLRAPSVGNSGNYVLPAVVGSVGQVLTLQTSNGIDSATMTWTTPVTGITLPYSQSADDASSLFSLTNTNNAGGGGASFTLSDPDNTGVALQATSAGYGAALDVSNTGFGPALVARNTGEGSAATLSLDNPSSYAVGLGLSTNTGGAAVAVTTTGAGNAGSFVINNATNGLAGIDVSTNGEGAALLAVSTGVGPAADLRIDNAANISTAVQVINAGTGSAGTFEITNSGSTATALTASTDGTGLALQAIGRAEVYNGDLTLSNSGTAGQLRLHEASGTGTDYTAFVAQDQSGNNITYTLPATNGSAGQVLSLASSPAPTSTSATLQWATAGGLSSVTHNATLSGSGTSGSPLAVNLGNANTWTANQTFAGTFVIASNSRIALTNSDNNGRDIRWQEPSGTGTQYVGLRAPSVGNSGNYVLPAVVGSVGQVLTLQTSNGIDSATMAWTTPGAGAATVDSTLVGDGTGGSPLGLDLAQMNTWTATITTFLGFLEVRNEPLVITNTDNSANELRIQEASGNGTNYFAIRADTSISTNDVWIMPSTAGTAGQVLGITAVNTPSNRFTTLDWMSVGGPAVQSVAVTSGAQGTITLNANTTLLRFTGATGAYTIDGFTGGTDGRVLYVYNTTGQNMTLKFNTATTASDGLNTLNDIDGSTIGEGGAILVYDSGTSRWLVMTLRG